jgi:effector-binding domain-containing protein
MKRLLLFLVLLLIASIVFVYLFIPTKQSFSVTELVPCTATGAVRTLAINKGWPGVQHNDSSYLFQQMHYTAKNMQLNSFALQLKSESLSANAVLLVEEVHADTAKFSINFVAVLAANPVSRVLEFFQLKKLKATATVLLTEMKQSFADETIIYGILIERTNVKDSTMISLRKTFRNEPTVTDVYTMIDALRAYISSNNGEEQNAPMLHVYKEAEDSYLAIVAIPTKTDVTPNENFLLKRMLAGGFILTTDITGGTKTVEQALNVMKQYVTDHRKSTPAIPFQLLLTDRRTESDTLKWKTKLYYPIFY